MLYSGCSLPQKTAFKQYQVQKQSNVDCAILVASPQEFYEYLRIPFEFIYELVVASALKEHLEISNYTVTFNAKWEDLQKVLLDKNIKAIVVAGHGKWYNWDASDTTVNNFKISKFMKENKLSKRNLFFIRHTCGNGHYGAEVPHLYDNYDYAIIVNSLARCGARNIIVDDSWTEEDSNFGKKRNRISYVLVPSSDKEKLDSLVFFWNAEITARGIDCKRPALGDVIVNHNSKTRGYEGTVSPLEYLLNPIPKEK